jgi:hypothetical protein
MSIFKEKQKNRVKLGVVIKNTVYHSPSLFQKGWPRPSRIISMRLVLTTKTFGGPCSGSTRGIRKRIFPSEFRMGVWTTEPIPTIALFLPFKMTLYCPSTFQHVGVLRHFIQQRFLTLVYTFLQKSSFCLYSAQHNEQSRIDGMV